MKKKILSAALVLALVLCFLPMTALADSMVTTFTALQQAVDSATDSVETKITLGGNINDMTSYLNIPQNKVIILDLNGNTLDRGLTVATANGYVILNNGTLTIQDSVGTGTITGGYNTDSGGGVINKEGATLKLTGGSITGNTVEGNFSHGGGVHNKGTFTMTGGSIKGNTAGNAGGGVCNEGTFTMTGGTITGNAANRWNGSGVANMGTLYLGGTAVVMGNTANDVQNQSSDVSIDNTIKPTAGMCVGFTGESIANATEDDVKYFFTNDFTCYLKYVENDGGKIRADDIPDFEDTNNRITVLYAENGVVYADKQFAASDEKVTIEVVPAEGYHLKTLTYTPSEESPTTISEEEGEFKFTMPGKAVTVTAEFEKHIFDNYESNNDATCNADGTKTATCTCGATDTITDEGSKNSAPHSFDTANWTTDANNHWHASTCGHAEEKDGVAAHADNNNDHKCDVCGYVMSECKDDDGDGFCDVCNAEMPKGFDFGGLFDGIFGLIRFKKTTDDIKTFSILAIIFEFIKNIISAIFG